MPGPNEPTDFSDDRRGVIPRSIEHLFYLISSVAEKSEGARSFQCKCSVIEICNGQIFDLVGSTSAIPLLQGDGIGSGEHQNVSTQPGRSGVKTHILKDHA